MAVSINTYGGIKAGVSAWLARSGDPVIEGRFDDFLMNCERRMYYGYATEEPGNPLRSDPLRIVEMEAADSAFALLAVTPQPAGFLELISVVPNGAGLPPLQIVSQRTIDAYGSLAGGSPARIAVSGTNFRVDPDPGTGSFTATLRYYRKLATPDGSTANAILQASPDVYLYGCLVEASIFTQDEAGAVRYLALYNSSVAGLNARTQRITASAAPVMRLRGGGMTP